MKQTLLNILKSTLGATVLPDSDFLAHLNTVYDAMLKNPSCLNPPVDMAGLKSTIDAYAAAVSAAARRGSHRLARTSRFEGMRSHRWVPRAQCRWRP